MSTQDRNSAVEILRILSMFFVVLVHFNRLGINPGIIDATGELTLENGIGHMIQSIAIVAVDVFVLISGYFGIRFKVKGVLRLYLMCLCWGIIAFVLFCIFCHRSIGRSILFQVLAFTQDRWWFILAYLYLYFAAPLLNAAVEHLTKRGFILVLALYTVSAFYFGYFRGVGDNMSGYSFAQFVYLYLIGRFINRHVPIERNGHTRKTMFLWWLLFTGMTFSLAILNQVGLHGQVTFLRPYPYNSPFVVGAAICLLCYSLTFSYSSRMVNCIAGSVLPAYLLQESLTWGHRWLYPAVHDFLASYSITGKYLLLLLISFVFLLLVMCVDLVVRKAVYDPILSFYGSKVQPKEKLAYERLAGWVDRVFSTTRGNKD